tara:strand:- start:2465 stop:2617 length:153 start_codon:yes stop_codon:yes gene_type:complete
MCSADIFLGLIAILFPPLAGKKPCPLETSDISSEILGISLQRVRAVGKVT